MPHPLTRPPAALVFAGLLFLGSGASAALAGEQHMLGKTLFTETASPPCAICHTLADADAEGEIGPDLDQLKPSEDMVRLAVSGGVGAMPAYGDTLTPEEIDALALYVSTVTSEEQ